jgi:carbonic anhydrase
MRYSKEVLDLNQTLKKEYAISKMVNQVPCPILGSKDYDLLQKIADSFEPTLIKILNQNKNQIQSNYNKSIYSKEISFEEYFIWVYHFIYTEATDELIRRKEIKLPKEDVAFYILKID